MPETRGKYFRDGRIVDEKDFGNVLQLHFVEVAGHQGAAVVGATPLKRKDGAWSVSCV